MDLMRRRAASVCTFIRSTWGLRRGDRVAGKIKKFFTKLDNIFILWYTLCYIMIIGGL